MDYPWLIVKFIYGTGTDIKLADVDWKQITINYLVQKSKNVFY